MGKTKLRKITKNIFIGSILPLVLLLPMLLNLSPSSAYAALSGASAQRDRTILYALIRCLDSGEVRLSNEVWADKLQRSNISGIIYRGHEYQVPVGYEIDNEDGSVACDGLSLHRAMRPIEKTPEWFFKQIYDYGSRFLQDGKYRYPKRSGMDHSKIARRLGQQIVPRDLAVGRPEKLRRLATAFWLCAEPAPNPPDSPTSTIGGKKYQLKDGKSGDSEINVGYDLENSNGKFQCNTLLNWGNKREMADALREHPRGRTPGPGGGGGGGGGAAASEDECGSRADFSLSWIMCPVIEGAQETASSFYGDILEPLLKRVPINVDDPSKGGYASYTAWQSFRILANITLVGVMLMLVYGMIRGGGGGR